MEARAGRAGPNARSLFLRAVHYAPKTGPQERRSIPTKPRQALARSQSEFALNMSRGSTIDELEVRFTALMEKIAMQDASDTLSRQKLEDTLDRLGVLEERC
jgi:hypothetical protein